MTHDELIKAILFRVRPDEVDEDKIVLDNIDHLVQIEDALRAVVELHKPLDVETEGGTFTLCNDCSRKVDLPGYGILYPCKTIQAIEKELK